MSKKDWYFQDDNSICDLRSAGILICDDRIFVQYDERTADFAIPGGHVQIGENTQDALVREYKEETDWEIHCEKLLWTEESFWKWKGRRAHTLTFYYKIQWKGNQDALFMERKFPQKDNPHILMMWIPMDKLAEIQIYPTFLKDKLKKNLEIHPEHIISVEDSFNLL